MALPALRGATRGHSVVDERPIAFDLFCGLGGWAEGLLATGWRVIGFDLERRFIGRYPGELILQDVLTICGRRQFRGKGDLIVASPPCTEPSYRAMPWKRAKALNAEGPPHKFIELFQACFRIAEEAGLPLIVENVKGAQPWVGSAKWHYGSFYLWGDVPALMPLAMTRKVQAHRGIELPDGTGKTSWFFGNTKHEERGWRDEAVSGVKVHGQKHGEEYAFTRGPADGIKQHGSGAEWFDKALDERRKAASAGVKVGGDWFGKTYAEQKASSDISTMRRHSSRSDARREASAQIAKIPFDLARHIGEVFYPR